MQCKPAYSGRDRQGVVMGPVILGVPRSSSQLQALLAPGALDWFYNCSLPVSCGTVCVHLRMALPCGGH